MCVYIYICIEYIYIYVFTYIYISALNKYNRVSTLVVNIHTTAHTYPRTHMCLHKKPDSKMWQDNGILANAGDSHSHPTAPQHAVPHCTTMLYTATATRCTEPHHAVPHSTTLHRTAPRCTTLHHVAPR